MMKKQSKETTRETEKKDDMIQCVDLSQLDDVNKIEVAMNGKTLPLKIGDKIVFPEGDVIMKTVSAVQINECGIASYLLQWYDDCSFKQVWVSTTELKLLKDQMLKRTVVSLQPAN